MNLVTRSFASCLAFLALASSGARADEPKPEGPPPHPYTPPALPVPPLEPGSHPYTTPALPAPPRGPGAAAKSSSMPPQAPDAALEKSIRELEEMIRAYSVNEPEKAAAMQRTLDAIRSPNEYRRNWRMPEFYYSPELKLESVPPGRVAVIPGPGGPESRRLYSNVQRGEPEARLAALAQAEQALRAAGLEQQANALAADREKMEKEIVAAQRRAEDERKRQGDLAAAGHGEGWDSAPAPEIREALRELRAEVQALRAEVKALRELLAK